MPLRFEDWSNQVMRIKMRQKYQEKGFTFPEDGKPFLIKVFLEPPNDASFAELKKLMENNHIPVQYLDTFGAMRNKIIDLSRVHIDLYGDILYDSNGKLLWPEERIQMEGFSWKNAEQVFPRGEGRRVISLK